MSRKKMAVWGTLDVGFILKFLLSYNILFVHGFFLSPSSKSGSLVTYQLTLATISFQSSRFSADRMASSRG
jgi:hypothetical protein